MLDVPVVWNLHFLDTSTTYLKFFFLLFLDDRKGRVPNQSVSGTLIHLDLFLENTNRHQGIQLPIFIYEIAVDISTFFLSFTFLTIVQGTMTKETYKSRVEPKMIDRSNGMDLSFT